ncbi:hypothetical protein ACFLZH_04130 [Patescibacteria group bacterium]
MANEEQLAAAQARSLDPELDSYPDRRTVPQDDQSILVNRRHLNNRIVPVERFRALLFDFVEEEKEITRADVIALMDEAGQNRTLTKEEREEQGNPPSFRENDPDKLVHQTKRLLLFQLGFGMDLEHVTKAEIIEALTPKKGISQSLLQQIEDIEKISDLPAFILVSYISSSYPLDYFYFIDVFEAHTLGDFFNSNRAEMIKANFPPEHQQTVVDALKKFEEYFFRDIIG